MSVGGLACCLDQLDRFLCRCSALPLLRHLESCWSASEPSRVVRACVQDLAAFMAPDIDAVLAGGDPEQGPAYLSGFALARELFVASELEDSVAHLTQPDPREYSASPALQVACPACAVQSATLLAASACNIAAWSGKSLICARIGVLALAKAFGRMVVHVYMPKSHIRAHAAHKSLLGSAPLHASIRGEARY